MYQSDNSQPGEKRVLVKFAGTNKQPVPISVGPGVNSLELLRHFGLLGNDYEVLDKSGHKVYGDYETLYPQVRDGELIYVSPHVDAGNQGCLL